MGDDPIEPFRRDIQRAMEMADETDRRDLRRRILQLLAPPSGSDREALLQERDWLLERLNEIQRELGRGEEGR